MNCYVCDAILPEGVIHDGRCGCCYHLNRKPAKKEHPAVKAVTKIGQSCTCSGSGQCEKCAPAIVAALERSVPVGPKTAAPSRGVDFSRTLTTQDRKQCPVARGVLDYFPDAIRAVANCSYVGNEQHNPGQPMHWAREKSTDHADCIARHLQERGTVDTDGVRHSAKIAWRALAILQLEIEAARKEGT